MANSTKKKRPELGRHPKGFWFKKYKGRFYCFYKLAVDPNGAFSIEKWRHDREYVDKGPKPRLRSDGRAKLYSR